MREDGPKWVCHRSRRNRLNDWYSGEAAWQKQIVKYNGNYNTTTVLVGRDLRRTVVHLPPVIPKRYEQNCTMN